MRRRPCTCRRIILPADDVSAGVPNAAHSDLLSVAAVDESRVWQALTMRAWYSVVGRRGYALEDGAGFLSERGAVPGDELVRGEGRKEMEFRGRARNALPPAGVPKP